MGIPEDITIFIKEKFNIRSFIETGTYQGNTAAWAARNFDNVYTIEFAEEIYNKTKLLHEHLTKVQFMFGDSREVLSRILPDAGRSVIWLDAHWCSLGSYGENDQCPLLKEIEIINTFDKDHFILIDDARLFLSPPPLPNLITDYPNINQLVNLLNSGNRKIYIYEDVIFAVPDKAFSDIGDFLQSKATSAWQEFGKKQLANEKVDSSGLKKAKYHFVQMIKALTGK